MALVRQERKGTNQVSSGNSLAAGSARVLVVDDDPLVRGVLVDLLAEAGFDIVGQAVDGLEALEIARRVEPDVVLLDINMPRLDGIACCARLRDEHPRTHVVILSAEQDDELRARAFEAGASAFLAKGGPFAEIVATLRDVLGRPD
jgi:DNA-binding NarL/FixJ family response regulator